VTKTKYDSASKLRGGAYFTLRFEQIKFGKHLLPFSSIQIKKKKTVT